MAKHGHAARLRSRPSLEQERQAMGLMSSRRASYRHREKNRKRLRGLRVERRSGVTNRADEAVRLDPPWAVILRLSA